MELGRSVDGDELESIYNGELNLNEIIKNPILKPISEINKSYENLELGINRALFEFQEKYNKIKELLDENPKYGETILVTVILNMMEYIKQIVHSQDLQKQNMKDAINEMIAIVNENYMQINEDEDEEVEKVPQIKIQEPQTPIVDIDEKISTMNELSKIAGDTQPESNQPESNQPEKIIENIGNTIEEKNKKVYRSDLLDKNIAVPN